MRTIFDGLVEEFRAWHLFEQQAGNSPRREPAELPGLSRPGYGGSWGPDYGAPQPGGPEFGRIDYGHDSYYDRAPRYGWDLDATVPGRTGRADRGPR